jgi:hypothetical protein
MSLTDLEIRKAKPDTRLVKLSDGGGLQLWLMPDGAKRWRLAYRYAGSQKALAIGVYPAVGLKEAREAREEAKRLLAEGQDPSIAKKAGEGRAGGRIRQYLRPHRERTPGQEKARGEGRTDLGQARMASEPRSSCHRRLPDRRNHRAGSFERPSRRRVAWPA